MKTEKLLWADLITVYLWHTYPKESMIDDDRAWVALLRILHYVEWALKTIEAPAPLSTLDEEK